MDIPPAKQRKLFPDVSRSGHTPPKMTLTKVDRAEAVSRLRQIKQAFEKGTTLEDKAGVLRITVTMRAFLGDYLLEAIDEILKDTEAHVALQLGKSTGQPKKEKRDVLIALQVKRLRNTGMKREKALVEVADKHHISFEAAKTACKKGTSMLNLIAKIDEHDDPVSYRLLQPLIEMTKRYI